MYELDILLLKSQHFSVFIERFGYIGILIWFITFDQLAPLPEEISLLVLGYLSAQGIFNPVLAGIFSLIPFLIVDSVYFFLAKKGSNIIKKRLKGLAGVMEPYKNKLKNHFSKTMFVLSFIPRMRLFTPVLAVSIRVPYKKFLIYDTVTLCVFISIYLGLGFVFHSGLSAIIKKTESLQHIIFIVFTVLVAATMVFFIVKRKKQKH